MRSFIFIVFTVICVHFILPLSAQQTTGQTVSLWIGGKSGFYGISYEHIIDDNYILGTGAGSFYYRKGSTTRTLDYQLPTERQESGTYRDISFMSPFYGGLSYGNKHRFNIYAGLTLAIEFSFNKYPSENVRNVEIELAPFVGSGYEYRGEKYRFNSVLYLAYLGKDSGWLPSYMPWLGVGFGRNFVNP